jgi:hypothetical protein
MSIRVARNASGNCLVFYGQTNPVYFNACLTAEITDVDYVSVKNDIASFTLDTGETTTYEYYRIHYSEWENGDGDYFESAQEVVDYINSIGNVTDVPTGGYSFSGVQSLDFVHDETKTSILFSNGDHHGINAIKAVGKDNGKVGLHSIYGDFEFYELEYAACFIEGVSAGNTLQTVVNNLNAYFTLSAQTVPIPRPVYTQEDGVDIVWNARETIDPIGSPLYGSAGNSQYHGARVYTTETINEPGEYFTFELRNTVAGGGPFAGIGLYSVSDGDLTEVTDDTLSNSGHHGYFWSNWLYNYTGYTAPWTTYGSNSGLSYGPGWSYSGNTPMFRYSDAHDLFRNNTDGTCLFKCGITDEGFVGVWYYDIEVSEISGSYGARSNGWILLARSSTPLQDGEYGLMVKIASSSCMVMSQPKRFATDAAAPTLYYRYIESPDGEFHYPLFATEEEANYVSGDGTSHQHMYADDTVPGTVWYMPNSGGSMGASSAPIDTAEITYTEIPTQDDSNFVPSAYSDNTITVNEGDVLNIQLQPQDTTYLTQIGGFLPNGWAVTSDGRLIGTAPEVTGDTTTNPSDSVDVTVFRTNDFGTSTGVLTIVINNLTAPTVDTGDWTVDTGSIVAGVLQEDSLADLSMTLEEGDRIIVPKEWVDAHIQPNNLDVLEKIYMGVLKNGTSTTQITLGDFNACFRWEGSSSSSFHYVRINDQLGNSTGSSDFYNYGASIYDFAFEIYNGDLWLIACNMNALNTEPAAGNGGSFSRTMNCGPLTDNGLTSPFTVKVGTHAGTVIDLDDALTSEDITKIDIPEPAAPTIVTPWTKAVDFSGSSERAAQVSQSSTYNALRMRHFSGTVAANSTPGFTSDQSSANPWATAVVFNDDGNSSNQHIWNQGEGAGDSDDNIYLRQDAIGNLYFGWGRSGALNECSLGNTSMATWHGVYIASTGERLSGANATAANLADCFSIRRMFGSNSFSTLGAELSTSGNWITNGGRMDRSVTGDFTIGGRGANRNFHGKVAAMTITTLQRGVAMPDDTEIATLITDPLQWQSDYRVNSTFRPAGVSTSTSWNSASLGTKSQGVQMWLMGDTSLDSYSNMIRNRIHPTDQNYTKLNLLNMVSNDIQTVNIPGLS